MPKQMVSELQAGQPVDTILMVAQAQVRLTRTGSNYLNLKLQDSSGQVDAKLWDATEAFAATIHANDFLHVKGKCELYQNQIQINLKTITKADPASVVLADFLPRSPHDPAKMMSELAGIINTVQDKDYRALADAFLKDKEFYDAFSKAPAAITNHHAYLGGLLEHTLSMMKMAVKVSENYKDLRRDLLLVGAFLHDIGKIEELGYKCSFQYTTPGNLVGHIMLGVLMLDARLNNLPEFPEQKKQMIRHMMLSHHGQLDFGSPKLPMFAEAIALHYLDNLDAKLKEVSETIAEDKGADQDWTDYSRSLERKLYKG